MIRGDARHVPMSFFRRVLTWVCCVLFIVSDSPWKVHLSNVGPEMTGIAVRDLTPARTYQFRVCAVNQVGKGQYSAETSRCVRPAPQPGDRLQCGLKANRSPEGGGKMDQEMNL